uniref:Putative A/G-specific DNA glycosylase n=1 Tax=uncultured microorganism TaxID=358574 RepID=E0X6P0_9ZZZZ|nr:putative A/G-specific DNA glycosylase [uncultured microorganism]
MHDDEAEARLPRALTPQRLGAIRRRLLRWYDGHAQPFPWRSARDPYAALVAAVCAQQTQMSRVLTIYDRWIASFPTIADLAAASDADVLRVWDRAGYPRRALYLRRAAIRVMEHHQGRIPSTEAQLLDLPGVGPFTAAIVQCFGFGIDSAAVDTNVVRLLGRLLYGDLQPARETPVAQIRWAAARLMPAARPLAWNPAVMDFGAMVCAPTPKCDVCPLATLCAARDRFAAGERAEPLRAQGRFAGSQRELRGMLMRELRNATSFTSREVLIGNVTQSSGAPQRRIVAALEGLVGDGLASVSGDVVRLGTETDTPLDR